MENKAHAELKKMLVESVQINVDPDRIQTTSYVIETSGKAQLRVPKENDDLTFLLVFTMELAAEEHLEVFSATIRTNFFFELDQPVKDYDKIVREQCLSVIKNCQQEVANKLLSDMGYQGLLEQEEELASEEA